MIPLNGISQGAFSLDRTANIMKSMVSITQFNKGQSARIFDRLKKERRIIVLKNNVPAAIILSPEEYMKLVDFAEDQELLAVAEERTGNYKVGTGVPWKEAMNKMDLTEEEIDAADDPVIE
jgi:antitoxin StbD